jgi:hypothetical protein
MSVTVLSDVRAVNRLFHSPRVLIATTSAYGSSGVVPCRWAWPARRLTRSFAALAKNEQAMISSRTKAALAAAKARGVKLGRPKLTAARKVALDTVRAAADNHAANVLPIIRGIRRAGATTLREIADALNARGSNGARRAGLACG